jgi:hypothetical protein
MAQTPSLSHKYPRSKPSFLSTNKFSVFLRILVREDRMPIPWNKFLLRANEGLNENFSVAKPHSRPRFPRSST